jgi:hypothetical protein
LPCCFNFAKEIQSKVKKEQQTIDKFDLTAHFI